MITLGSGFLDNKQPIRLQFVLPGLLLWILWSYILYAFFILFLGSFNLIAEDFVDVVMVFSDTEYYWYKLFYAATASAMGYGFAVNFVLQNNQFNHHPRIRLLIRRTIAQHNFYTWSFTMWFIRVTSILGLFYLNFALQYEINYLREAPLVLILIPLVLFYVTWPQIARLVRKQKLRWFGSITIIYLLMSFTFAFKDFINQKRITQNLLNQRIEYVFDLQVVESQTQVAIRHKAEATDIYLLKDTTNQDQPLIFMDGLHRRVRLNELNAAIRWEKDKLDASAQLKGNLHIDGRLTMHTVNDLIHALRKAGLGHLYYSTVQKNSIYPVDYPGFRYRGIPSLRPIYYLAFEQYLDSLEQQDLRGKRFNLTESRWYRQGTVENTNRVKIDLSPEQLTLNGQAVDSVQLKSWLYRFIQKYKIQGRYLIWNIPIFAF